VESFWGSSGLAFGVESGDLDAFDSDGAENAGCAMVEVISSFSLRLPFPCNSVFSSTSSSPLRPVATSAFRLQGPRSGGHEAGGCLYIRNDSEATKRPTLR